MRRCANFYAVQACLRLGSGLEAAELRDRTLRARAIFQLAGRYAAMVTDVALSVERVIGANHVP